MTAAQRAWPAWAALSAAERIEICLKALETLPNDLDERAEVLSRENGKIRFEAEIDLHVFGGRFHEAAVYARELDTPETIAGPPYNTTISHLPQGVVTIIYPFNWPLAILAASLPHALMAGNTVIVKPPPTTPLSSVLTLRHVAQLLPPGVLNVVTGADAVLGPVVVGDPRVKHVCFTGSTAGGKRIMEMASANVTNVTLELGGNDPAMILDDAVLDEATIGKIGDGDVHDHRSGLHGAQAPLRAAQPATTRRSTACGRSSRARRSAAASTPTSRWARSTCERQRDYVEELLAESRAAGTEVIEAGEYVGRRPERGQLHAARTGARPVRSRADRDRGAVRPGAADHPVRLRGRGRRALANDTWAGLCASVWSADDRARDADGQAVARRPRVLQQPQRDRGRRARHVRRLQPERHRSRARARGRLGFTETQVLAVPDGEPGH